MSERLNIRAELETLADEPYRTFHSRLIPETSHPILGVRVPKLRALAKRLAKEEGAAYLERAKWETYEEVLLWGLVACALKEDVGTKLERLRNYASRIDNWAECDIVCSSLKETAKYQEEVLSFLRPLLRSEREYEVRFAVVLLLGYYVDEMHIDGMLELLTEVSHPGYYVKMAVAWALSVCYVKFPEKTMECLKRGGFDDETYNKALQKMVESDRVDKETKAKLRGMKRKEGKK